MVGNWMACYMLKSVCQQTEHEKDAGLDSLEFTAIIICSHDASFVMIYYIKVLQ